MTGPENHNEQHLIGASDKPIIGRIWKLAEPLCLSEGLELVHVSYQREPGGRVLRLYVDKPGGVSLDDCVTVSRQLGDMLDVGEEIDESYRMEVSSPGQNRPLSKLDDFHRFIGCRAKIHLARPVKGQKNFTGTIDGIDDRSVKLTNNNHTLVIELANIANAHLIQYNGETAC
jgi:ribosome maturation factor RimP